MILASTWMSRVLPALPSVKLPRPSIAGARSDRRRGPEVLLPEKLALSGSMVRPPAPVKRKKPLIEPPMLGASLRSTRDPALMVVVLKLGLPLTGEKL